MLRLRNVFCRIELVAITCLMLALGLVVGSDIKGLGIFGIKEALSYSPEADEMLIWPGNLTLSPDGSSGVYMYSNSAGSLVVGGVGGDHDESIIIDAETTEDRVIIDSGSGASLLFNPAVYNNNNWYFLNARQLIFGTAYNVKHQWNTAGNGSYQVGVKCGYPTSSGYYCIMDFADTGHDNRVISTVSNHPVLRVYSSNANDAGLGYGESYHDDTNFNIASGKGDIVISPAANVAINNAVKIAPPETDVAGSSSGNACFSMPLQGALYKRVNIRLAALDGTASYTFPTAFDYTPVVITTSGLSDSLVTTLNTANCTITGSADTGFLFIEGQ